MAEHRIAVVGSYNRDIGRVLDQFPAPGETRQASAAFEAHGGKGGNQALQAAQFSAGVYMIAAVGDDTAGQAALALWRERGIDVAGAVTAPGVGTGTAVIFVNGEGENLIVIDPGANAHLTPEVVDRASAAIAGCDLVLAQLETAQAATKAAFEIATAAQAITVLNAAPSQQPVEPALLDLVDILVVNEIEARQVAGQFGEAVSVDAAVAQLLRHVRKAVIVTLGGEGAALFERDQPVFKVAAPKVEVVDSTGAGDAFIGAFVAQWTRTGDLRTAVKWGAAAGSFACLTRGAGPSFGAPAQIFARFGRELGLSDADF